jgi:hypothetical protein
MPMRTKSRRSYVRELLSTGDSEALLRWAEDARSPFRTLISLIFDDESVISHRAVEFIGLIASTFAKKDIGTVRRLIRRFLWMMNDESGNVGWNAPEAIGEILLNVPQLIPEYGHLLPSFLDQEPFRIGARIAVSRIASVDKSPFDEATVKKLTGSLEDEDPRVRGTSLIAVRALGVNIPESTITRLSSDHTEIRYYDFEAGKTIQTTVGKLAGML